MSQTTSKRRSQRTPKPLACPICTELLEAPGSKSAFDVLIAHGALPVLRKHLRESHKVFVSIESLTKAYKKRGGRSGGGLASVKKFVVHAFTKKALGENDEQIFTIVKVSEVLAMTGNRYCVDFELENDARQSFHHRFAIGTFEDPDASKPSTWAQSTGARELKAFLRTAGIVPHGVEWKDLLTDTLGQKIRVTNWPRAVRKTFEATVREL